MLKVYVIFLQTKFCNLYNPELHVQGEKEEENCVVELNKTMTLDESEENVYRSTLMFCKTLKSFKAVDFKETSMEVWEIWRYLSPTLGECLGEGDLVLFVTDFGRVFRCEGDLVLFVADFWRELRYMRFCAICR